MRSERLHRAGVGEIAVDLVGQDGEAVLLGELDDRQLRLARIHRAGGVVGIDQDQRARAIGDQAPDVIEIRLPAIVGIGAVEHRLRPDLGDHRGVERIGRHRHEHLVVGVDQRVERDLDALGGAGGEQHPIGIDWEAACTEVVCDRLARLDDAGRRRVAVLAETHGAADRFDQVGRRREAGRDRIPDVQVADSPPGSLDLPRLGHDVADRVAEAVDPAGDRNRRRGGGRRRHLEILLSSLGDRFDITNLGNALDPSRRFLPRRRYFPRSASGSGAPGLTPRHPVVGIRAGR